MYHDLIYFAETGGLVFLFILFLVAVIYALWPGNGDKFDHASRMPLEDGDNHNNSFHRMGDAS